MSAASRRTFFGRGKAMVVDLWKNHRAALVIAHPGHELRVHHWLERAKPLTLILTDGSGHTGRSRIRSTTVVLDRVGAKPGPIYGEVSDRQLYQALLAGEREFFARLVEDLVVTLQREQVTYVVGDAVEGFNPAHDVCRLLINAALLRMERSNGAQLRNMDFLVEGPPDQCPDEDRGDAIFLELDDGAYQRKIDAVRAYPELATETDRVLMTHAPESFRIECLRPVRYGFDIGNRFEHPCVYERYGEKQVAAGKYTEVIRYREHIAPLAAHLDVMSRCS